MKQVIHAYTLMPEADIWGRDKWFHVITISALDTYFLHQSLQI